MLARRLPEPFSQAIQAGSLAPCSQPEINTVSGSQARPSGACRGVLRQYHMCSGQSDLQGELQKLQWMYSGSITASFVVQHQKTVKLCSIYLQSAGAAGHQKQA